MVILSKGRQSENLSVVTLLLRLLNITGHGPVRARKQTLV